jgi:DNA repair protein RAD5
MDVLGAFKGELVSELAVDPVHGVHQVTLRSLTPFLERVALPRSEGAALQLGGKEENCLLNQSAMGAMAVDAPFIEQVMSKLRGIVSLEQPAPSPPQPGPAVFVPRGMSYSLFKKERLAKAKQRALPGQRVTLASAHATKVDYSRQVAESDAIRASHCENVSEMQILWAQQEIGRLQSALRNTDLHGKVLNFTSSGMYRMGESMPPVPAVMLLQMHASIERLSKPSRLDQVYIVTHKACLPHGQDAFSTPSAVQSKLLWLPASLASRLGGGNLDNEALQGYTDMLDGLVVLHLDLVSFLEHTGHSIKRRLADVYGEHAQADSFQLIDDVSGLKQNLERPINQRIVALLSSVRQNWLVQQFLLESELQAARNAGFDVETNTAVICRVTGSRHQQQRSFRESRSVSKFFAAVAPVVLLAGGISVHYPSIEWSPLIVPSGWHLCTQGLLDLVEHNCILDKPQFLQFSNATDKKQGGLLALQDESVEEDVPCEWVRPMGLNSTLFPYQRRTVAWMLQQEELPRGMATYVYNVIPTPSSSSLHLSPLGELSLEAPLQANGGAIFSTMGTGKTVMALALILSRPRHALDCDASFGDRQSLAWVAACDRHRGAPKYRGVQAELAAVKSLMGAGLAAPLRWRSRATLIVAPVSLVGQWASEATKHTPEMAVALWHGDSRTQSNLPNLLLADIVLTTYELLASCSSLFDLIEWHRVVFDESQRMKNASIKMVWYAQRLAAPRRWLLSGTPISHTGLKDLGGQLAALHAPDVFWDVDCLDKEAATAAAVPQSQAQRDTVHTPKTAESLCVQSQAAAAFTLWWRCVARRQTVQGLISRGEISLPPSVEETLIIPFASLSPEERMVYRAIRSRVVRGFRLAVLGGRSKGLAAAYIRSLSLLRRLRMAIGDVLSVSQQALKAEEEPAAASGAGAAAGDAVASAQAAGDTPTEQLASFVNASINPGTASLERIMAACEDECIICFCPIAYLAVLPCMHIICCDCWKQLLTCSGGRQADCPMCRATARNGDTLLFNEQATMQLLAGDEAADEEEAEVEAEAAAAANEPCDLEEAIKTLQARQQSTKITFAMHHIETVLRQNVDGKIIVFTQFSNTVSSLTAALKRAGVKTCLITGSTSMQARTRQLFEFAHNPTTRVFVLSIRSAGVGLNLTAANHVLFMEPNENIALVSQAVSRVLRLGQTKVVKVTHLQVEDSVEADISAWAERIRSKQGIRADIQHQDENFSEFAGLAAAQARALPASATLVQGASKESKGRLAERWADIQTIFGSISAREEAAPGKRK